MQSYGAESQLKYLQYISSIWGLGIILEERAKILQEPENQGVYCQTFFLGLAIKYPHKVSPTGLPKYELKNNRLLN